MCGILGFDWEDKSLVKLMSDSISHRGPDSYGSYTDKYVSLGHRRLSIVDLSAKGNQPMSSEDGSLIIVFNGEIYNYKELRLRLENLGYRFNSHTDTETIIYAYKEYGERCLEWITGDFAFCIYDSNAKKLFIARDRLGVKPLYYTFENKRLIFASEVKAILKYEEVKRELNMDSVNRFFRYRYNNSNDTFFKSIKKLGPSEYMIYDLRKKTLQVKKYWGIPNTKVGSSYSDDTFDGLITESVKNQMIGDVPLGVFLSGGIDSTAIVAMMKKNDVKKIMTFSINFGEDERSVDHKYAKIASDYYGTTHYEYNVDKDVLKILPLACYHMDDPIADPAAIPTFLLSKHSKKKITVAFSGAGGDEIFGGYEHYKFMQNRKMISVMRKFSVQKILNSRLSGTFINILRYNSPYLASFGKDGVKRFSQAVSDSNNKEKFYEDFVSINSDAERKLLLAKNFKDINETGLKKEIAQSNIDSDYMNAVMRFEARNFLVEDVLMMTDKMAMANSLECRVPLLDNKIVEYYSRLPSKDKVQYMELKKSFKRYLKGKMPESIIKRRKQGFFAPIDTWFGEDMSRIQDFLDQNPSGIVNDDYRKKLIGDNINLYKSRQVWTLLNFEIWYNLYVRDLGVKELTI